LSESLSHTAEINQELRKSGKARVANVPVIPNGVRDDMRKYLARTFTFAIPKRLPNPSFP